MSQTTYKVFVGNLSFKTKAEELAVEFSIAGKVVGANIICRGPRSLGYGFVEMETEEDANKSVALLNKKNIDGRDINVEIAKPRDESKLGERRTEGGEGGEGGASSPAVPRRGRGGRGRGGRGGPRGGGRGGRGGNGRANVPRGQEVGAPPENNESAQAPAAAGDNNNNNNVPSVEGGAAPRRRYRNRSRSGGERGRRGGRGGRFNRQPREDNRTPSLTTLFVANLPFSLDDAGLLELFKTHNPSKAHVVLNRNGRSKGFGFVEFNNQEDQTAAAAAEKKTVDNRELIVKIALTSDNKSAEGTDSQEGETKNPEAPKTN